ncbi:MarR family transcriptional regulator [Staphylococcus sp. SQ8-PEA]|uniref:MarR family transcriptional regulator n=1 Tax=Staphylococcus marylandisciuri TaxID=2981529 RepID=A0ABT2QS92_9STAP|nr:MarR family transcriptional regulator [Staphylococcus marylandisciuri]MCU5746848.1 MarR family transcriptional regulator [Staphylococcus marylandisciuri]
MGNKTEQQVEKIIQLDSLFVDIEGIFNNVQKSYDLSREEILILLTLWDKGSMTLKEMDDYVQIKSYKRTRTYNDLVNKAWIIKERPKDDERTVIIHFNPECNDQKQALLSFIANDIRENKQKMQSSLNSILNL